MYQQVANPTRNSDARLRNLQARYAAETDAGKKLVLYNQIYQFDQQPLTNDQKDAYDYVVSGYIDDNPGHPIRVPGDRLTRRMSYVGIYYGDETLT